MGGLSIRFVACPRLTFVSLAHALSSPRAALPANVVSHGERGQARDETQSHKSNREADPSEGAKRPSWVFASETSRAQARRTSSDANLTIARSSEPPTGAPSAERVRGTHVRE